MTRINRVLFSSLRTKLIFWFIVIAVVPLLATATFGYLHSREAQVESTFDYLKHIAETARIHLANAPDAEDLQAAWERFPERELRLKEERFYLVSDRGTLVDLPAKPGNAVSPVPTGASEGLPLCTQEKPTVTGTFRNERGVQVLAIYLWLGSDPNFQAARLRDGSRPLILAVEILREVALAPLIRLRNRAFAFSGLLLILIAGTGLLVARGVSNPILHFVRASKRIREGNLSERVQVKSRDEIGILAAEFNRMVDRLQGLYDSLEEKVEERTRQLADTQDQLVQTEKLAAVGSLAASVAHEIRNPLAGISGAMQVIGETFPEDDSRRHVVKEIRAQIDRLDQIVNDMLIFAKPNPPQRVSCDMVSLLEETLEHLRTDPAMKQIDLRRRFDEAIRPVPADPAQIEQVLANLILNAGHAMAGQPGLLRIRMIAGPDRLRVELHDSGPGIDEAILATIFDPFFTTKHRGTGLGLSISRKIMEAHGGRITVSNDAEGGACFVLEFPWTLTEESLENG